MSKKNIESPAFSPNNQILYSPLFPPFSDYQQSTTPYNRFSDFQAINGKPQGKGSEIENTVKQKNISNNLMKLQEKRLQQKGEMVKQNTFIKLLMSQSAISEQCYQSPNNQKKNNSNYKNDVDEANSSEVVQYLFGRQTEQIKDEKYECHSNADMKKKNNNKSINPANNIINNNIIHADNGINNVININDNVTNTNINENYNQNKSNNHNIRFCHQIDLKENKLCHTFETNVNEQNSNKQIKKEKNKNYLSLFESSVRQYDLIQKFVQVLTIKKTILERWAFWQLQENDKLIEISQTKKIKKCKYASPKDIDRDPYPPQTDIYQPLPEWQNYPQSFNSNNSIKKVKRNTNYNFNANYEETLNDHKYELLRSRRKHIFTIENINKLPSSIKQDSDNNISKYDIAITNHQNTIKDNPLPLIDVNSTSQQEQYIINIKHPITNDDTDNGLSSKQINKKIVTIPEYLTQDIVQNWETVNRNKIDEEEKYQFNNVNTEKCQKINQMDWFQKTNYFDYNVNVNRDEHVKVEKDQEMMNIVNNHNITEINKNYLPDYPYYQQTQFGKCDTEVQVQESQHHTLARCIDMVVLMPKEKISDNANEYRKQNEQFVYPQPFVPYKNENNKEMDNFDSITNLKLAEIKKQEMQTYKSKIYELESPKTNNFQFGNLGDLGKEISNICVDSSDNNYYNKIPQPNNYNKIGQVEDDNTNFFSVERPLNIQFNNYHQQDTEILQKPPNTDNNNNNINEKLKDYYHVPQPGQNQIRYYQSSPLHLQQKQQSFIHFSPPNNIINIITIPRAASSDKIKKPPMLPVSHPTLMHYAYQMQNNEDSGYKEQSQQRYSYSQQNKLFSEKCILPSKVFREPVSIHSQSMKNIVNTDKNVNISISNTPYVPPFYINRPILQPKPSKITRFKTISIQKQDNLQIQPQLHQQLIDHDSFHGRKVGEKTKIDNYLSHFESETKLNNKVNFTTIKQPISQNLIPKSRTNFVFPVSAQASQHSPQMIPKVRQISQLYNPIPQPCSYQQQKFNHLVRQNSQINSPSIIRAASNDNKEIIMNYGIKQNQKNGIQIRRSENNILRKEKQIKQQKNAYSNNYNCDKKDKIVIATKPQSNFNTNQKNIRPQTYVTVTMNPAVLSLNNNNIIDDPINQQQKKYENTHRRSKNKKKIGVVTKQLENAKKIMEKGIF